jgi:hypothetical protein
MSREASRARARSIAQSLAQPHGSLADPALMGYPLALLCKPLQRPALPCAGAGGSVGPAATAPVVEAHCSSTYKE